MKIAVVVIGRNEAERLHRCLTSIDSKIDIVYVDSGSTDQSVEIARSINVDVVELDPAMPFSAARARNEGFAYLLKHNPAIEFVQFIDGDCMLSKNWLEVASNSLYTHANYGAVLGHLRELHPEASIYNRLCELEWRSSAVGDLTQSAGLGGISMIRASVFNQLGGFNPKVIAGEEPEFAVRIAQANFKVIKLDHAMAVHDANILHFSQWWKRAVRSGHAIGQAAFLNGNSTRFRKRNSTWFWGIGVPLVILISAIPTKGWSLCLLIGYSLLAARIFRYCRKRGNNQSDSLIYGVSIVIAKFAETIGLLKFYQNHRRDHYQIIEYK